MLTIGWAQLQGTGRREIHNWNTFRPWRDWISRYETKTCCYETKTGTEKRPHRSDGSKFQPMTLTLLTLCGFALFPYRKRKPWETLTGSSESRKSCLSWMLIKQRWLHKPRKRRQLAESSKTSGNNNLSRLPTNVRGRRTPKMFTRSKFRSELASSQRRWPNKAIPRPKHEQAQRAIKARQQQPFPKSSLRGII